jgi:hypothetical protein
MVTLELDALQHGLPAQCATGRPGARGVLLHLSEYHVGSVAIGFVDQQLDAIELQWQVLTAAVIAVDHGNDASRLEKLSNHLGVVPEPESPKQDQVTHSTRPTWKAVPRFTDPHNERPTLSGAIDC